MIVVVEPQAELAGWLKTSLERRPGVDVRVLPEWGEDVTEQRPPFVVLDIESAIPKGFEVCRVIQRSMGSGGLPLVLLRRTGGELTSVETESTARIDECVRLAVRRRAPYLLPAGDDVVSGGLPVDASNSSSIGIDGCDVTLAPLEAQLVAYLATHRDRTVPRAELLDRFWGYQTRSLDVHIRRLRMKLRDAPYTIRTTAGVGYRLVMHVDQDHDKE